MRVTIQVQPEAAQALHQRQPATTESQEVLKAARSLGVELKPMHPDIDDPYLNPYFTIDVPDAATAERVIARLRHCKAIEAAYIKPPDAMA